MANRKILWADDEIDLLKPYILFLKEKGFDVHGVVSGTDALEEFTKDRFDLVFLDENMPGMSGLETLEEIKSINKNVPIVMITKSEEEDIMEQAIGAKIADYLIKPLNPRQILSSIKKILDKQKLVSEKTNSGYQQDFRNISMAFFEDMDANAWMDVYKKLVHWELEIEASKDNSMAEVLEMQKAEANRNFFDFIHKKYSAWMQGDADKPVMSFQLLKEKVFPYLPEQKPTFFILIDNLRYDQWEALSPIIAESFSIKENSMYYSILPTTTAYARNSIFAGMPPLSIKKKFPEYWVEDIDEEGKNQFEEELLAYNWERNRMSGQVSYHKITQIEAGKQLADSIPNLASNRLNVIVYNFVDMLSHARTDMEVLKELAPDESAYRSVTKSWFQHSPLAAIMKQISKLNASCVITTDHGTVRVQKPVRIAGDKSTNSNLRYKNAKNLDFEEKGLMFSRSPEKWQLPSLGINSTFVFAPEDKFFCYPNNFNYYANYYKDTFQHGGISLEEMIIPFVWLEPKAS